MKCQTCKFWVEGGICDRPDMIYPPKPALPSYVKVGFRLVLQTDADFGCDLHQKKEYPWPGPCPDTTN